MGLIERVKLQSETGSRWDGPAIRPLANRSNLVPDELNPAKDERSWGFWTFSAFWLGTLAS